MTWLCLIISLLTACAADNIADQVRSSFVQNNLAYIDKHDKRYLSIQKKQPQLAKNYLQHWFSPWTDNQHIFTVGEIKQIEIAMKPGFMHHPGWGQNMQKHDSSWIASLFKNADLLDSFPNLNRPAIVIRDTNVRILPTHIPAFYSLNMATADWYPFDTMQTAFIAVDTPILILHKTLDGTWYLIMTPNYIGWIPRQDIAFVNKTFIHKWQTGHYVVANKDNVAIFRLQTRMGILYPVYKTTKNYNKIFVAVSNSNQNAVIKIANLPRQYSKKFPIKITPENIATMANAMLDQPYGWGDLYGYRDCSGTLLDLFTGFGIWLPKSAIADVLKSGYQVIYFSGMNNSEKEKTILAKAIPFLTLIHKPGHIMLYIGKYHGQLYVFHATWGLKKVYFFPKEGRARIGGTVITPLRLGDNYINVPQSLLDRSDAMVNLGF
jgi:hypothetical protein